MTIRELVAEYALPAPTRLNEERLERIAETFFNRLDRKFMSYAMSLDEYDATCAAFASWEAACHKQR